MSTQDLVPETKFEKQVPYTLIGEISEAVKASEARLPKFPAVGFMQIDRIEMAFTELGHQACEEPYDNGAIPHLDPLIARKCAIKLIAETIRYIQTLPKP